MCFMQNPPHFQGKGKRKGGQLSTYWTQMMKSSTYPPQKYSRTVPLTSTALSLGLLEEIAEENVPSTWDDESFQSAYTLVLQRLQDSSALMRLLTDPHISRWRRPRRFSADCRQTTGHLMHKEVRRGETAREKPTTGLNISSKCS